MDNLLLRRYYFPIMSTQWLQGQIDRLLKNAEEAIAKFDWDTVRQCAQGILALDPANDDGTALLAAAERALVTSANSPPPTKPETAATPTPVPTATSSQAERRQLTVMFCDLQGSTALSQQLDPENLRDVILSYQEVCAGAISRFEGHIAKYLGDGLMVYFGYPLAHEDDPQRGVRAGLAILEDMRALNTRLREDQGLELTVRIGVHTGLVVAGEMGGGDTLETLAIVGETPNIASRLEGEAEPNTLVISDITANLIKGFFHCEALGSHELKGISQPMELFHVVSESGAQSRFDVASAAQLTPLVGREQELGLLMDRWEQVEEGMGQVVLLSGEAGIGKSRLLEAINDWLEGRPHFRQEYRCSPYYQNSALHPMISFLERWLRFRPEDTPEERLNRIKLSLEDYGFQTTETVTLMAGMLSVPLDDRYPPLNFSPQVQRQKSLELALRSMMETAARRPVLVVFEDLHWADPTTLEFLGLLIEQAPTIRVLVMLTFRPEFTPPWSNKAHVTQISLNRLPRRLATDMMAPLTAGKELPEEVVAQISTKSDGVPLFVEELTRMVIESGLLHEVDGRYELSGPLPALAIPSTLQDSLTARLDRLSTVRESVQLAAVLGREFNYELMRAVSPLVDVALAQHLEQLVASEFLYQRGIPPEADYIFKHALIQDAAYNSLLISWRQQYHQQVAQVLEERFAETVETQPELVAHHYTEAGINQQAVTYWQQAGERAARRSDNLEAISHLTKGLELLGALPDTPERAPLEVALQTMLGQSLVQTRGYSSPEVQQTFSRARELIDQIGETPQHTQVLYGLWGYYLLRAENRSAIEMAEQLLESGQRQQEPILLQVANRNLGCTMIWTRKFTQAQDHLSQGIAYYDIEQHRAIVFRFGGQDPTSTALAWSAMTLWFLGYPDQASARAEEAIALAQEIAHPFNLAYVLAVAGYTNCFSRLMRSADKNADMALKVSAEHGFGLWAAIAKVGQGVSRDRAGYQQEGITMIREALAAMAGMGTSVGLTQYMSSLAEAHLSLGETENGFEALAEGFDHMNETDERYCEAELNRVKGELLLLPGGSDVEAEECFSRGLEVARIQSAKSWELRTAISMARLWEKQGKVKEARELLAGIYGWFTEGFDTPDLIDAKALLKKLA